MGNHICKAICNRKAESGDALDRPEPKARDAGLGAQARNVDIKICEKAKASVITPPPVIEAKAPVIPPPPAVVDLSKLDDKLKAVLASLPAVGAAVSPAKAKQVYEASQIAAKAVIAAPTSQRAATWAACDKIWAVAQSMKVVSLKAVLASLPEVGAVVSPEKAKEVYEASQMVARAVVEAPTSERAEVWAASDKIWAVAQSIKVIKD